MSTLLRILLRITYHGYCHLAKGNLRLIFGYRIARFIHNMRVKSAGIYQNLEDIPASHYRKGNSLF